MTPPTPPTPPTPMDTVTLERRIAGARPETVFTFLTDRDKWLSWMGTDGTFSFEPGGEYRTRVTGQNVASGRFLKIDPPSSLTFTWGWEGPATPLAPGSTTVQITLDPTPGGGTVLHLIHTGLPTSEACEAHAELWQHYIDRLTQDAEGTTPTPAPWTQHPPT